MQIRCYHCNKPYALRKENVYEALEQLKSERLSHYDIPCPHCRRVNRVSQQELLRSAPEWKRSQKEQKDQ